MLLERDFDREIAKFTPKQMEMVRMMRGGKIKFGLYGGALAGGKLLSIDTPVPTPEGWSTMGELNPGDKVFDERGVVCNVVGVTGIEEEDTYLITFSDGSQIIAGGNHQWVTRTLYERQRLLRTTDEFRAKRRAKRPSRAKRNKSEAFVKSLSESNSERLGDRKEHSYSGARTTKAIKESLMSGASFNHSVDVALPLELPERELAVDPYVLGAWLGDGTTTYGSITCADEEILEQVAGAGFVVTNRQNSLSHNINGLKGRLRDLGVLGYKHIPIQYLRSSKEQRLALLQGIMDTDGYCDSRGQCEITLTNKKLSEDVLHLILSLGSKCTMRESEAKLKGKVIGPRYRMKFVSELPVFRLSRKLIRQKRSGFKGTHNRRYITSVEQVDRVPLRCIEVDSPSHCYLCGDTMIPTHNSYYLRWRAINKGMELGARGFRNVKLGIFCETYPALKDRQISWVANQIPSWIGDYHDKHKLYDKCFLIKPQYGGAVILFRNLDDPEKYKSVDFAWIGVDELTLNPYTVFEALRQRLRWAGLPDSEAQFEAATNPTGIGMGWVKRLWVERSYPEELEKYSHQFGFVQSLAVDNPFIDAAYAGSMDSYPEQIRAALRDGRWDMFGGQAFPELTMASHGMGRIIPSEIAQNYQLVTTFDWGYGKPFSHGWWYVDCDGRLVRFAEWYGSKSGGDVGLEYPDSKIAEGIIQREREMGLEGRQIYRLAGHDCFNQVPNRYAEVKGKSTAEVFAEHGLYLMRADNNRLLGIRQFRQRLKTSIDGKPLLMAATTCTDFFRTIPMLVLQESGPNAMEDVEEKNAEDHVYDEVRQICMFKMLTPEKEEMKVEATNFPWMKGKAHVVDPDYYNDEPADNFEYDFFGDGGGDSMEVWN